MALTREDFYDDQLLQIYPSLAAEQFYNDETISQTLQGGGQQAGGNPLTQGLGQSADQVRDIAQQLFPNQNMSQEDLQRLSNLEAQQLRLQPLQAPARQGSTRIAGNPYSYDRSPVFNAIQQGLTQLINARRQKKLLGDPEKAQELRSQGGPGRSSVVNQMIEERAREAEGVLPQLSRLQTQQEQAQTAQQSQDEFLMQMFPEIAQKQMEVRGNLTEEGVKQEGRLELANITDERRRALAADEIEYKKWAERQKNKLDAGDLKTGQITGLGSTIESSARRYQSAADALVRLKGTNLFNNEDYREEHGESIDTTIENLRNKADRIASLSARAYTTEDAEAARNILEQYDKELDFSEDLPGGDPGGDETGSTTIDSSTLQSYADQYFGGDTEAARKWARDVRGYTIED